MMNKQEKIDKIYEVISDKTLSFGCKVFHKADIGYPNDEYRLYYGEKMYCNNISDNRNVDQIIGHPVMIGDVLQYIGELTKRPIGGYFRLANDLILERENKTKPIDDQSEAIISFVYQLTLDSLEQTN